MKVISWTFNYDKNGLFIAYPLKGFLMLAVFLCSFGTREIVIM